MTWKQRKTTILLTCAGALALVAPWGAIAQTSNSARAGRQLEGTWRVNVQQENCKTGAKVGPPFVSLISFALGGTMTETTSNPMFYPAERSPGHGVWSYLGRDDYRASSIAFITVNGALTATQVITQAIEIENNPDTFTTSAAKIQFFKPDGTLLRAGCAVATGKRFE